MYIQSRHRKRRDDQDTGTVRISVFTKSLEHLRPLTERHFAMYLDTVYAVEFQSLFNHVRRYFATS